MAEARFRSRFGRAAVLRAAALVFCLSGAVVGAVVFTLDRNARIANHQQAATDLASAARVAASSVATLRANLKANTGELAASPAVQRAVVDRDFGALRAIARRHSASIELGGRTIGVLPAGPRLTATAKLERGTRVVARLTVGVPLDSALLAAMQRSTPLPSHGALVLVSAGRVVAGGPVGAHASAGDEQIRFGPVSFEARGAALSIPGAAVLAVEPTAAIDAQIAPYQRRLFFAALMTLALAAGLATRLGRPVARVLGDVARLSRQAQTDGLTRLANRRALDERLDLEVDHARRLGTGVSFVIADIDDFKSINDRYGHQAGDDVLRAVAAVFAEVVREIDLPGRYGGEEFAVVLPGTQLAGARRLADRIRKAIAELALESPGGEALEVTASFGVASFPTHPTVESLVAAADGALYVAKRSGKNRVETATARKKTSAAALDGTVAPLAP